VKTLSIDIGNTRIRAGVVDNQLVDPSFQSPIAGGADRVAELFDWCVGRIESDPEIDSVALCSVVDTATQLWSHLVQGKSRIRALHWHPIDHRSPMPFSVDIEAPETIGADRFANVAGACARGMDTALVVDLGTANTYDLLVDGRFRGGLIAPGCAESHQRLVERGSALPDISFVHNPSLVGRNTREAIEAGSFRQALAGVSGVIDTLLSEVQEMPVLLTGGLAEILGPELPGRPLYLPDLTLEGAAEIARWAKAH
jgi:type III pantothenate kinase